jgi:hypothetical protein
VFELCSYLTGTSAERYHYIHSLSVKLISTCFLGMLSGIRYHLLSSNFTVRCRPTCVYGQIYNTGLLLPTSRINRETLHPILILRFGWLVSTVKRSLTNTFLGLTVALRRLTNCIFRSRFLKWFCQAYYVYKTDFLCKLRAQSGIQLKLWRNFRSILIRSEFYVSKST